MYWETPRHPRAGVAIGVALLAAWVGALGVAFATDDSAPQDRRLDTPVRSADAPSGVAGRASGRPPRSPLSSGVRAHAFATRR
jgi:hypothetical protein